MSKENTAYTVADLIQILQGMPQDAQIYWQDDEGLTIYPIKARHFIDEDEENIVQLERGRDEAMNGPDPLEKLYEEITKETPDLEEVKHWTEQWRKEHPSTDLTDEQVRKLALDDHDYAD